MKIESLGHRNILLTSAELQCFKVACGYQRKVLVRRLLRSDIESLKAGFARLGWSHNPVILAAQWSVLLLTVPLLLLWWLPRFAVNAVLFPFRYLQTFVVPRDLAAPGEKTLIGIHNAFNRHLNLDVGSYICCVNDWIRILYGEEVLKQHSLDDYLAREMQRLGMAKSRGLSLSLERYSPQLRALLSVSREKASMQLGHYLKKRSEKR